MTQRINAVAQKPELYNKLVEMSMLLRKGSLGNTLHDLVQIRASQLNGCGFCVDMHVKEATLHDERPLRLLHLPIWRESGLFSPRERAALAWTEALTRLSDHGVPDEIYEEARAHFSESEMTELSFIVMTINAWNRLSVGFRNVPGSADKAFGLDKAGLA